MPLDPASMPAAGRPSYVDSLVDDTRRPTMEKGSHATTHFKTTTRWYAEGTGRVGALPIEREKPPARKQREVDYLFQVNDIDGARPQNRYGHAMGPRVLPNGIQNNFESQRKVDPNAPIYHLPKGNPIQDNLTAPPSYSVHGLASAHHPLTAQRLENRTSSRSRLDNSDLPGSMPVPLYARQNGHSNTGKYTLDYSDVHREKSKTQGLMHNPRKDAREAIDTGPWPVPKWRQEATNPLTPAYKFDKPGQDMETWKRTGKAHREHPDTRAFNKTANGPADHELEGRMRALEKRGCGDLGHEQAHESRRYNSNKGIHHLHDTRPFPVKI
ncbi:hypothetical protein CYMTET_29581 [Cymbomonas tetramitiformis]|uniref:Uncharacterized protein n=1 Tax=Cymbomonas tetramitiformis TaxID=36881 RepID=A0AAE0KUR6_9CHLO|nr:hypothetical protein CYMTET_29581 [Cymbomonas tetramitiformis]